MRKKEVKIEWQGGIITYHKFESEDDVWLYISAVEESIERYDIENDWEFLYRWSTKRGVFQF